MERALILGAKSAIAQALALRLAEEGVDLVLAARRSDQLEPFASDLRLRTERKVDLFEFDALDFDALPSLPMRVHERCSAFDLAVLVFGYLGDHQRALDDAAETQKILHTNFTGAALVLNSLARYFEGREGPAGIIGISSVAGDRGRQSNYIYGAAKGGLSIFLQGLRNRLSASGVHVMTVKPGFVDTPMTEGMEGLFLVASPEKVASDIVRAYKKKKNVLYTPWFWRYIMLIIRSIPESIFKKLKL